MKEDERGDFWKLNEIKLDKVSIEWREFFRRLLKTSRRIAASGIILENCISLQRRTQLDEDTRNLQCRRENYGKMCGCFEKKAQETQQRHSSIRHRLQCMQSIEVYVQIFISTKLRIQGIAQK